MQPQTRPENYPPRVSTKPGAVPGAMALVVVGAPFGEALLHRQHRRGPIQRLDLGLLIHAQHDRVLRWRQVQTDDIGDLGDQFR